MAKYKPTAADCWNGRVDGDEPDLLRWHQVMQILNMEEEALPFLHPHEQGIALIGFCCDEGVKRNRGRSGAAKAPASVRKACSNMPVVASHIIMADGGDIICDDGELLDAQEILGGKVASARKAGYLPIIIGGGHEVALASFKGITPLKENQEFGIINFDAHFDLRPVDSVIGGHSGSGIAEIKAWCDLHKHPMHYLAIGIQQYSNTKRLFETANSMDAVYILAENFCDDQLEHIITVVNGIIGNADVVQLTMDMDVFSPAFAPGVSAPSFNGISPNSMFKRLLRHIVLSGKVAAIDIAEVNPDFDIDDRTSRLAASIIFDIVQAADVNTDW